MASIDRTAYPRPQSRLSDDERNARYSLSGEERDFVRANARGTEQRLTLALMLKTFGHLGYFPDLSEIPEPVRDFVGQQLDLPPDTPTLAGPQRKPTLFRYRQSVLALLGWTVYGEGHAQGLRAVLETAAETMSDPADLINVAVEDLVKSHVELPAFSTLDRLVATVRTQVHEALYTKVTATLTPAQEGILESLLVVSPGQSTTPFTRLKQTPGPATLKRIALWIEHLAELDAILDPRPFLAGVVHTKVRQFAAEASALSISDIRDVKNRKRRHTLLLSLLDQAQSIARDELVEMFLRRIRRTRNAAQEQLRNLQDRHRSIAESLLSVFGDLLRQARKTETDDDLGRRVRAILEESGGLDALESEYTAISAYHENNYLPLLWPAHAPSRSVLFRLLELLELRSASQDTRLLEALDVVIRHRHARRTRLSPAIDLGFASQRWQNFVLIRDQGELAMDRHALEVCVFLHLADALRSGDLYVVGSQSYADYRTQLLPWETCRLGLAEYCEQLDLPQTGAELTARLRAALTRAARDVDAGFPDNSQLSIDPDGVPHLKRQKATALPERLASFEAMVRERMPERHLLDILKHAHHWAGYTRHFGPPSGSDPKLAEATKRYLFTVFGYGCNLGESQTAQHISDINRFAIRRINAQHITTPKLEAAMNDVIAEYVRFELPGLWGDLKVAIADGTHVELRENNLLGERHIRYGKYGGINYQHISSTYIALFTKFIACGVWEAVYILDALLEQRSELQPDTLHADTHGQSEPVFGLALLLGIELFPRMRTWNDAVFYRPSKSESYKHIDALFSDVIDWNLIERHWQDMMQVALSIQAGKILPSMLLRKLGSHNRKNKLYRAFRELGRVVRTLFLLRYISEAELRRTIRAETTKVESFNDFLDWISFGGPVIKSGDPVEQTKRLKYMNLVANAVMLQNVVDLTGVLNTAAAEGYPVTKELVGRLSPYMRDHIRRFGQYVLDMDEMPEPLGPEGLKLGL
jgi:TnpA family transposase